MPHKIQCLTKLKEIDHGVGLAAHRGEEKLTSMYQVSWKVCRWSKTRQECEGDGDVVGVVTPLVRGGAQVLHGDQVVELSVLLEVHEREEKGEDGEGQIEVENERGELKERRTCTWMT